MRPDETELESVDLMHYIDIAWKRRWQIIIPTVIVAVLAGIVSFLLPKVWEVDAIIIPSKFLTQSETGDFKEILVVSPVQIASQISQRSYDAIIGAEINIPVREFPKITADNLRNTNLVRISIRDRDPQKGRQILLSLFNHMKADFDKKIDVEISNLNNQVEQTKNKILDFELAIEDKKIAKERTRKDIESDKNKIVIAEQRIAGIQEEMKSVKTRITELDELQQKTIAEKKDTTETLALLMYSTEVQNNLRYYNSLDANLSTERINVEDLKFTIKSKEQQLSEFDNQIAQKKNSINNERNNIQLFEERKNRIDYTNMLKEPTSSLSPVFPNKKLIVLVAGFVAFWISLGISIFIEKLDERRNKYSLEEK